MQARLLRHFLAGLALYAGVACPGVAGSFSVTPVRATLSADLPVSSFTVRNAASEPTVVQLELMQWSQQNGQDVYTATRELLATPPIFTLPAGGAQVIRIGLRRPPDRQTELAYRLFLQEVPAAPKPDFRGLQVALRLGVPVFVTPAISAAPALRWQVISVTEGELRIRAANEGASHVQVTGLQLDNAEAVELGRRQLNDYLLPGQYREWTFKVPQAPDAFVRIKASTDAGDIAAEVSVQR